MIEHSTNHSIHSVGARCSYIWAMGAVDADIFLCLICVPAQSLSCIRLSATLWTVARQAPLSVGFPKQEYWSGLPFPSLGYTLFTWSISCELDEILCMRGWKLTVTPLVSGWVGVQSRGVSDDLYTDCLPQGMVCWLVRVGVWICQGQHPVMRTFPAVPREVAVFLCISTDLSQGRHRERVLAFVSDGLSFLPVPVGFLQGWHSRGAPWVHCWLQRFYVYGVEAWGTLNSSKFDQLCSH